MRLRWTPTAYLELQDVVAYIAIRNPQGAAKVHARIRHTIDLLVDFPAAGRATREPGVRRILSLPYPYIVSYEVMGEAIVILSVRHARRRPSPVRSS
jgi:toxin ParE1/3/4